MFFIIILISHAFFFSVIKRRASFIQLNRQQKNLRKKFVLSYPLSLIP